MQILSTAKKSWQYASQVFADAEEKYRKKQQWKSFYLTLLSPRIAKKWFETLQTPFYKSITPTRPRLYLKPFRVYISTKWTKKKRIKVIEDTYHFAMQKNNILKQIVLTGKEFEITKIALKENMEATLTLGYDERYRKEGEFVLMFNCAALQGNIVSISFSFEEIKKEKWVCCVGCVQGHELKDMQASKIVQKGIFGLRPKSYTLIALQYICESIGCKEMYGTGDSIQSYRKKHAIHLPWAHKINFKYNEFWIESGAEKSEDGWYQIPLIPIRRNIKDLKTSKRALYTRRYVMLDELILTIQEKFSHKKI